VVLLQGRRLEVAGNRDGRCISGLFLWRRAGYHRTASSYHRASIPLYHLALASFYIFWPRYIFGRYLHQLILSLGFPIMSHETSASSSDEAFWPDDNETVTTEDNNETVFSEGATVDKSTSELVSRTNPCVIHRPLYIPGLFTGYICSLFTVQVIT
jgi:hypothetical protein